MLDVIKTSYAYDTWATVRVLDALEGLSDEEYSAPECSGNGSIRDTLAHLLSCQWGWLSWLDGSQSLEEAYGLTLPGEAIPTVAQARARWTAIDRQTHAFVDALTDADLAASCTWTGLDGFSDAAPLWKLLLHVANHGTHTRAQIVAGIRRVGADPGDIDLLCWELNHMGRRYHATA
ncbi:DinB family protein [Geothrix paludis]|uniref:DinB family protein n=1 Tax=Geothrix paludis TaxID=2922722 RepID=UPI001FAD39EC|nr:DinB family protein [Geothrix paludis]